MIRKITQKIFLAFTFILFPLFAMAQSLSVNVDEAGSLKAVLADNLFTVETLIVSGELNDNDIATITDMYENGILRNLDLAKVSIEEEDLYFSGAMLRSIVFPDNLENIAPNSFTGSELLESVTLPQGLKTIGDGAFMYSMALETIEFPQGLESIGSSAFENCQALKSVVLPGSLGKITSYGIFNSCQALTSAVLEEGITEMGNNLFWSCGALESVSLPTSLTLINGQAFFGCDSLLTITIPENVQEIGPYAFMAAYNLRTVYSKNPIPPVLEGTFSWETKEYGTLYVPEGSIEDYKAAQEWDEFNYVQEEIVTGIEDGQMSGKNSITGTYGEAVVMLSEAARVEIYTLTGVRTFASSLDDGEHRLPLRAGVYVAKVGTTTSKIIVQ